MEYFVKKMLTVASNNKRKAGKFPAFVVMWSIAAIMPLQSCGFFPAALPVWSPVHPPRNHQR